MRVQSTVHVHDATIDQIERETVTPTVSDDALVTPGTLTVALDTSDAPQAMQDADGNLTGYAVDAARALACRMGLKVAFVDASSADSALSDKKADIFIGDIKSAGGDISSLGTCLYDAAAVFGKSSDGESLSVSTETLNTATLASDFLGLAGSACQAEHHGQPKDLLQHQRVLRGTRVGRGRLRDL